MLLGPNGMGIAPETIGFQTCGTILQQMAHPSLTYEEEAPQNLDPEPQEINGPLGRGSWLEIKTWRKCTFSK